MSDFEIIIINDFSIDKSLNIIKKFQKEDKRIKVINNKKNMGTLYSRCIGTLNSKGEYIFPLDNDDIFSTEDLFKYIYNIADKYNYDIVEFKSFDVPNYDNLNIKKMKDNFFNHHPNNLILHQPELSIFPISRDNSFSPNDYHIWGKCIRTQIYKKAINSIGKERYSFYNCWTEDIIIVFVIFNFAKSFIFLNKYGIIHLNSINTTTYKLLDEHKIMAELYLLDIIIEYLYKNKKNYKYIIEKAKILGKVNIVSLINIKNRKYLNLLIKKIFNCEFITNKEKIEIKNLFKLTNLL